jgi:hypothetical protein
MNTHILKITIMNRTSFLDIKKISRLLLIGSLAFTTNAFAYTPNSTDAVDATDYALFAS